MKKRIITLGICGTLLFFAVWYLGGRTAYDYGLKCTKCHKDYHVVERKFLGFIYNTKKTLREDPPYYAIFTGQECDHVFRRGGFGRSTIFGIACGITGEGNFFRERNRALRSVFHLGDQLDAPELAKRTIGVIDSFLPPDVDWLEKPRGNDEEQIMLFLLGAMLEKVENKDAWSKILSVAEAGTLSDFEKFYTQQGADGQSATAESSKSQ